MTDDLHSFEFQATADPVLLPGHEDAGRHFFAVAMDGQLLKGVTDVDVSVNAEDRFPRITVSFVAEKIVGFPLVETDPQSAMRELAQMRRQSYYTACDLSHMEVLQRIVDSAAQLKERGV